MNCAALTQIELPSGLTELRNGAFKGTGLTSIELPDSIVQLGYTKTSDSQASSVFENCKSLISVKLPASLDYLGRDMFRDCKSLTTVTGLEKIKRLSFGVFRGSGIREADISGASEIAITYSSSNTGIFKDCANLTKVKLNKDLEIIPYECFQNCTSLKSITFPQAVNEIAEVAFAGSGLTEVVIPASVTEIGYGAFAGCENLAEILVDPDNGVFKESDGILYTYNGELVCCPAGKEAEMLRIEDVQVIWHQAFEGCTKIKRLELPATLIDLGNNLFGGWTADQTVYFDMTEEEFEEATGGITDDDWDNGYEEVEFKAAEPAPAPDESEA